MMKNKVLKTGIKFIVFVLSILFVWIMALEFIPKEWHLLIGWFSCSIYNSVFDFSKILEGE